MSRAAVAGIYSLGLFSGMSSLAFVWWHQPRLKREAAQHDWRVASPEYRQIRLELTRARSDIGMTPLLQTLDKVGAPGLGRAAGEFATHLKKHGG